MADICIPWAPRVVLGGRLFRLPVRADRAPLEFRPAPFALVDRRWSQRERAHFLYLRAPDQSGDYALRAGQDGRTAEAVIQVRTLEQLRRPHRYRGVDWPRRWPSGQPYESVKRAQTLQDLTPPPLRNPQALRWWLEADDVTVWRQLPPAEFPRAHYVNVHQGCPHCGTAIFAHHGFYPWKRRYLPADLRSLCPHCGAVFPSNDLLAGDFSSGDRPDDGFGYFDARGNVFLFAASYHRDMVQNFQFPIDQLTGLLRRGEGDASAARRLGLLLLRYAQETVYLAAVPQFRHGPSQEVEVPWEWGQPDWASAGDPIAALYRKGLLRYSIDVPITGASLALAYDTVWPFLGEDRELIDRVQALGLHIAGPADAVNLVEEMLAGKMQCCLDGGALSNLPRVSEGVLIMLRALDREDARDVLAWLYDRGPDRLRCFTANDFFPDGTPPEAAGGYNDTHSRGLFELEYHLRQLRARHGAAYPECRFPSLLDEPKARRVALAPYDIALLGRAPLHFGDGGSAGVQTPLSPEAYHAPLPADLLERAARYLGDRRVAELQRAVSRQQYRALGTTVLDGVGLAVLRTGEAPERAAAGIVYGDATGHRHMDLLDVQLYAFGRPFLSDLGYPQSWDSVKYWEGHWATHNTVWSVIPELVPLELPFDTPWPFLKAIAGRGRLLRVLALEGVQLAEVEAERWAWDMERRRWYRPGVRFRRLIALVETDGSGVALVDLARVRGGSEHWRVCRGLEGELSVPEAAWEPRSGTVAGAHVERGRPEQAGHPDYAALACMDQVAVLQTPGVWQASWHSCHAPDAWLDLHALRAPGDAQVLSARATAVLGPPEASKYSYRTLLWRARPRPDRPVSCVDLVFEPRTGAPTLAAARPVAADRDGASGVELLSRKGRRIALYWSPDAGPQEPTRFANGCQLQGGLAVEIDGVAAALGAAQVRVGRRLHRFGRPAQEGRIAALDRPAGSIDVEGLAPVRPGERIRVGTGERSASYLIEAAAPLPGGGRRLMLDVSSVLGRGRVAAVRGAEVELDCFLVTRTGYLHGARLERETDGSWAAIVEAMNPDMDRTLIRLGGTLEGAQAGDWVRAVAYVTGDRVHFEPLASARGG